MKKLPARYVTVVMPFFLSIMMTFIVSFISTWRSLGWSEALLPTWMEAWGLSWIVAFPTMLLVLPMVKRLTGKLVQAP
jgi:hypothetical protein